MEDTVRELIRELMLAIPCSLNFGLWQKSLPAGFFVLLFILILFELFKK